MRLDTLKAVAIAVSQERSLPVVLKRIVDGLAGSGGIALARVWLLGSAVNLRILRATPF